MFYVINTVASIAMLALSYCTSDKAAKVFCYISIVLFTLASALRLLGN